MEKDADGFYTGTPAAPPPAAAEAPPDAAAPAPAPAKDGEKKDEERPTSAFLML